MNFKKLAEDAGLGEEEFVDLVKVFVDVALSDLDRLKEAVADGVAAEVIEAAHSIKGSAVNFGFDELRDQAREIEMNARAGILAGAADKVKLLEGDLRLMVEKLNAWRQDQ